MRPLRSLRPRRLLIGRPTPGGRPRPVRLRPGLGLALATALLAALALPACVPDPPPPPASCLPAPGAGPDAVPIMGACPRVDAAAIASWFWSRTGQPYRATVSLDELIAIFLEEGRAEGVRGDLAFVQSIVETGWFGFGGRIPPEANNFSGLGATDGTADYGIFPDARTGVRAQIQHLRAYADPAATTCTVPPLHHACVDNRFGYVTPKGRATTWNVMGGYALDGRINWASDPTYGAKILALYGQLLASTGRSLA